MAEIEHVACAENVDAVQRLEHSRAFAAYSSILVSCLVGINEIDVGGGVDYEIDFVAKDKTISSRHSFYLHPTIASIRT